MADIELSERPLESDSERGRSAAAQALAPTDRGVGAWNFLAGSFVIEAILWGFPINYGVFQSYYSEHPLFRDSPDIAVVGTVATSMYFLGAPLMMPIVRRLHRWQRHMIVAGWIICCLSLLGASFATTVPGLIGLQGVSFGVGFTLVYFPLLCMLNEWWVRRRGLAYGVIFAGSGVSGLAYPFVLEALLSRYGYRVTLQAMAVAMFVLVGPALLLLKGRLPQSARSVLALGAFDRSFLREPLFWCLTLSNLFQGFAYYIPSIFLPSFSSLLGQPATTGALVLALFNLATIIGQLGFGYASDRVDNVLSLVFISSFIGSVAAFTLWGFAHSLAMLLVFAMVYGIFAGAWPVLWPKFGSSVSDDPQNVFSLMAFGKGIGSIATGPITAGLLTGPVEGGYGLGKFEPVIIFLGSFMFCSSMGILGWPLKRRSAAAS